MAPAKYVKLDLEGFEPVILREMFKADIFPETLCVECHDLVTVCSVIAAGYNRFKPVLGPKKKPVNWKDSAGELIKFHPHEAGPIWEENDEEIIKVWSLLNDLEKLDIEGLKNKICGWYDLHARIQK